MPSLPPRLQSTQAFRALLWLRNTNRMLSLVNGALSRRTERASGARRIVVPVMAWNDTDVPWFSIATGLLLADAGHDVTFVLDDLTFGDRPLEQKFVLSCVRRVMSRVGQRFPVVVLSRLKIAENAPSAVSADRIDALAALNALRDLRGEMLTAGRAEKTALFRSQLQRNARAVQSVIAGRNIDVVVVPGGIHASSGIWNETARAAGIRVATFDGGTNGTALWAMDGIACHFADVPRVVDRFLLEADDELVRFASGAAQQEMDARRAGTDRFGAQIQAASSAAGIDGDYLVIALNVPWDTQALDRHKCFGSICDFILETVEHVVRTSSCHIAIRQHPAERQKMTRSNDDYGALLRDRFGDHPQVHFIAAEAPVNSYALIEGSIGTLVHTSTIATEAVMLGKPTLTGAAPYFARFGFVHGASTKDDYFAFLDRMIAQSVTLADEQKQLARILYYFSQGNGWITTPFNTGGFAKWSAMPFAALASASPQQLLVDSITRNIPISWQNHELRLAARNAA